MVSFPVPKPAHTLSGSRQEPASSEKQPTTGSWLLKQKDKKSKSELTF